MKRKFNFIALLIFVCVNVLTPISYAESMDEDRILLNEVVGGKDEVEVENLQIEDYGETSDTAVSGKSLDLDFKEENYSGENSNDLIDTNDESLSSSLKDENDFNVEENLYENDEAILKIREMVSDGTNGIIYNPEAGVTYTDTNGTKFTNIGTITFKNENHEITILDRNLGATEVFNGDLENPNIDSYGYHFQWGNNYGFPQKEHNSKAPLTDEDLSNEPVEWRDEYRSGYVGNIFRYHVVNQDSHALYDYWKDGEHLDLWGGDEDSDSNGWGNHLDLWEEISRQNMCPKGFHVPSVGERKNLLDWRSQENDIETDGDERGYGIFGNEDGVYKFMKTFYMPLAGVRDSDEGIVYHYSDSQGKLGEYRTVDHVIDEYSLGESHQLYFNDRGNLVVNDYLSRTEGASIRCFKNNSYLLKILDTDGTLLGEVEIEKGGYISEEAVNSLDIGSGRIIMDLYENSDLSGEPFDFNTQINEDGKVLYAKLGKVIHEDGEITYVDTNGNVFDKIGTITFTDGEKSITMLDRNLGATSIDIDSSDSYGYYFQWGNNYGFLPGDNELSEEQVDVAGYGWNNPYVSGTFVQNIDSWIDTSQGTGYADNLRGGLGDYRDNTWDGSEGHDYMRQGPCPDGYHVPSGGEWLELLSFYDNDIGSYNDKLAKDTKKYPIYMDFANEFLLPKAGKINYEGFTLSNSEKNVYLRTSSPYYHTKNSEKYGSRRLLIAKGAKAQSSIERAYGFPVRCFKDNYEEGNEPLVLSYDTRGGSPIQAQTISEGENEYLPGYTTHRDDAELLGWYDDRGKLELDGNKIINRMVKTDISENGAVTIFARWSDDHVITFKDYDGSVIKVVLVKNGDKVIAPENLDREGYKFIGWNRDLTNITEDLDVIAQYSPLSNGGYSGGGGRGGSNNSEKSADHQAAGSQENSSLDSQNDKNTENVIQSETKGSEESSNIPMDSSADKLASEGQEILSSSDSSFTKEQKDAYTFAKENGITTKDTIQETQMNGKLTRIAMAKMLSQYAINVLGKEPDLSKGTVNFNDVSNKMDENYDNGVTLSYQLGIMGQNMPNNKFRPNDEVTRAEFVSAFSRMLYNTSDGEYRSTSKYYIHHMEKLEAEGIVTNTDPSMKERRGYVMIMLMRSAK